MDEILNDLEESELHALIDAPETAYGSVLFKVVQRLLKKEQENFDNSARICDDPIKRDFRVILGIILNCKAVLDIPKKALEILQQNT